MGQITSFEVLWKCQQVTLSKNCLRLCPSAKTADKLDFFKNASYHLKNSFCFVCRWISRKTGREIRKCLFFYVKIFKDNSVIWTKAIRYFIRFDLSYKLNVTASLGLVLLFQLCINSIFYLCLDLVYLPLNFNSINLFKNITAWKGVKYILTIISIGRRKVWNLWGASVIRGA